MVIKILQINMKYLGDFGNSIIHAQVIRLKELITVTFKQLD